MNFNHAMNRMFFPAALGALALLASIPAHGTSLTCTAGTFSASPDGRGNITVNCTPAGTTSSTCTLSASTPTIPQTGGSVTLTASNCGAISNWTKAGTAVGQTGSSWQDTFPANTGSSALNFTYTVNGANGSDSLTLTQSGTSPPAPPPSSSVSYPIAQLTTDDKKWLRVKSYHYTQDLKILPGSHQLLEDMLTDSSGRTVWQGANIQGAINTLKNDFQAGGELYDPYFDWRGYAGPLVPIYKNLVAKKLAGG